MLHRAAPLLLVVAALTAACPPKPAEQALPPAGLAGGGPGNNASLALPGAGVPVATPSGTATPGSTLPPGHPPIDGMAGANADPSPAGQPHGDNALPPSLTGANMAAPAAPAPSADPTFTGTVLEAMEVPEYTYMRVKTSSGEEWVAVTKTPVANGDVVTVAQNLVMENFHSKSLNRTFPKLVMGMLVGAPKKP